MGDMADMMLDGTMCSVCGSFIGSNNDYPTMCDECAKEAEKEQKKNKQK